jgi:thiamine-phosphate pyrophosphorylase
MTTNFGIYLIISNPVLSYQDLARIAVKYNIKYIQLREKSLSDREIIAASREIMKITSGTASNFIMNDRADLAKIVNADGLHLGQDDLSLEEAKTIFGNDKIYGLSTHSLDQAHKAINQNPDYIGYGPIFPTPTKAKPDPAVGLDTIKDVVQVSPIPVVAIGGIDETNVEEVVYAGAENISLVRYFMNHHDLEERLLKILTKLHI